MAQGVTIDLKLDVPEGTVAPAVSGEELPASTTYTYAPPNGVTSATPATPNSVYYASLRSAVSAAREDIGVKLTAWRDAVGDREKEKEVRVLGKKGAKKVEQVEMGEEDEEGDDEE